MDLRQLRYFVAVAEARHFGRAAERLHIAQSPLSQAIRQLEAHLGARLLERTTRRVEVTAAGEALLAEARRILASVDAARVQVEHVAAGHLGEVRCGVTGLAAYSYLPRLVRLLADELPGLSLSMRTDMLTPDQEHALLAHEIDLGILRLPVASSALSTRLLARERFVLVVPRAHRLAAAGQVRLADLAGEDFVVYDAPGTVVGAAAERACRAAGFVPRRAQRAGATSVVLALVAAGAGVTLLPESVRALGLADVRYLPVTDDITTDVALAWRTDDPAPALARLLDVVGTAAAARDGAGRPSS